MTRQDSGGLAFFDTNVLIYAEDIAFPEKRENAAALFASHAKRNTAVVSMQVLQEYFVSATRKLKLPSDAVQRKIEMITAFTTVIRPAAKDIIAAIELHRLNQISFWTH